MNIEMDGISGRVTHSYDFSEQTGYVRQCLRTGVMERWELNSWVPCVISIGFATQHRKAA